MFGGARVLRAATCGGWLTDPPWLSYGPELDAPSAVPFSADLRDTPPSFNLSPASFAQLAMGCPNPPLYIRVPSTQDDKEMCTNGLGNRHDHKQWLLS